MSPNEKLCLLLRSRQRNRHLPALGSHRAPSFVLAIRVAVFLGIYWATELVIKTLLTTTTTQAADELQLYPLSLPPSLTQQTSDEPMTIMVIRVVDHFSLGKSQHLLRTQNDKLLEPTDLSTKNFNNKVT